MAKQRSSTKWQSAAVTILSKAPLRAFTPASLKEYLRAHWDTLDAPSSLPPSTVIEYLQKTGNLGEEHLSPLDNATTKGGKPYPTRRLYTWHEPGAYSVALALRANSYFTHASAVFLNQLSLESPATIYVNREQSPKPPASVANQGSIDRAFRAKPRSSKYAYGFKDSRIVLLSGKNTGWLEVTQMIQPTGEIYPVTTVERTLIDCTVRPHYAGGLPHLLEIYRKARDRMSTKVLLRTLQQLDYAYPYHQAIGFLMERAGFAASQCAKLRELGLNYDFYLAHAMSKSVYEPRWRLHYPSGLQARN